MQRRNVPARLVAVAAGGVLVLAGCGGGGGGDARDALVVGSTDSGVSAIDPAGSYDLPSSTLQYNIFQRLMHVAPGGNKPEPDAAESCEFEDDTTYTCTLRQGLQFSNGDPLTSEDVKFSLERNWEIADPNGNSSIYMIDKGGDDVPAAEIETPDQRTVVFNLEQPDATWPAKLTYAGASIVNHDVFPEDELIDNEQVVGSGPYELTRFQNGQQAVFEKNENYSGQQEIDQGASNVIMRYYKESSALKLAVEQGEVDVAYRNLTPTETTDLEESGDNGVNIVRGQGTEIRYLTFNVDNEPFDEKAVRQAVAYSLDRSALASNVYNDNVDPLYGHVPVGLDGHTEAVKDAYGEKPNPQEAKRLLQEAGHEAPLDIELWYTPTHYGPATADEMNEVKRQLDATGAFNVTLKNTEWEQYQEGYNDNQQYGIYHLGWFPDYPDSDNYLSPFFRNGGFYNNNYSNDRVNGLLTDEVQQTDQQARIPTFEQVQEVTADELPTIPLWQAKQVAAVRDGVTGVEDTFDASFTFRLWLIGKN